ncbi:uncharacterized protein [Clinocottus analis]|uniref:uncharacterized protein n=1 Tax=Clinocottus analis TaxID=304258 RepID=UPI0035C07674
MAAALSRRGTGLCCIHRELCRVVWRPRTAPFSSKPPDKKPPPRTTHIKKAKSQPAVDVTKLLEQLFPERRPGTRPLLARLIIPPTVSSVNVSASNVPPSSKTEPAASHPPAVSSFKQVDVSVDRAARIDSGPVRHSIEPPVKASPVCEGIIEPADAPVEDEGNRPEEMTLESVTLHVHWVLVGSLQTDKLLQTISHLEEKADEQARELLVQTKIRAVSSSEDEPEILTEALSKWDSLSDDLRAFEGESSTLTEGLLCQAPPAKTPRSVRTSPAAGAKAVSKTLAEVEGLEVEEPRESRSALKEAVAPAKKTRVVVATAMDEETTKAALLTLKSVTLAEVEPSLGTLKEDEATAVESGNEDGQETHADFDPVQRLFLEKIKEYDNTRRLNGGLLEEPDHEKHLSEETAKLRRLYGGGDLSSFPQFTFREPRLDQDS